MIDIVWNHRRWYSLCVGVQKNMLLRNQNNMLSFNEPVENGIIDILEILQDNKNDTNNLGLKDIITQQ